MGSAAADIRGVGGRDVSPWPWRLSPC